MEIPKNFVVVAALAALIAVSSSPYSHAEGPPSVPSAQYCFDPPAQYRLGVWTAPTQFYEAALNQYISGLYVRNVQFGGPAHRMGIEGRDVIVRVGGTRVTNHQDFKEALNASAGLATIRLRNWRTGRYVDIPAVALEPTAVFNPPTADQIP